MKDDNTQPNLIDSADSTDQFERASLASKEDSESRRAAFGMGCFWHSEESFREQEGVLDTAVGFMGGEGVAPSYEEIFERETGFAEVVYMKYDPNKVSYEALLKIFWENHNPTQLNRQGPDIGTQYRSAIFYYSDEQKTAAEKTKDELKKSGTWVHPIVTEIVPALDFYKAEDYHQKYLQKRGQKTCHT
ncbi:peptide-methionine (S)-S-oxide reductase [Candidatus Wolfebacteria bacterium]|nr:MAG: peptide-methionine (S)-S-oxide reductase [Candidatus Wolfebacteria bacterium]